jgi:hypothetical protein
MGICVWAYGHLDIIVSASGLVHPGIAASARLTVGAGTCITIIDTMYHNNRHNHTD